MVRYSFLRPVASRFASERNSGSVLCVYLRSVGIGPGVAMAIQPTSARDHHAGPMECGLPIGADMFCARRFVRRARLFSQNGIRHDHGVVDRHCFGLDRWRVSQYRYAVIHDWTQSPSCTER